MNACKSETHPLSDSREVAGFGPQRVGDVAFALGLLSLLKQLVQPLQLRRIILLQLVKQRLVQREHVCRDDEAIIRCHLVGFDAAKQSFTSGVMQMRERRLLEYETFLRQRKVGNREDVLFSHYAVR